MQFEEISLAPQNTQQSNSLEMNYFLPRYRRDLSLRENFENLSGLAKLIFGVIVLGLFVLICIAIGHLIGGKHEPNNHDDPLEVCETPACVDAARFLNERIDENTSPCDDFYQFACGKWNEQKVIPEDKAMKTTFSDASDVLSEKLKVLLEVHEPDEPVFVANLRNYYASCLDTTKLNSLGTQPLVDVINKLGGFPVLGGWPAPGTTFDWSSQFVKMREYGMNDAPIKVTVMPDFEDNSKNIIVIDEATLGLQSRDYFLKGLESPELLAYYELLVKSAVFLGANEATATTQMLDVIKFETELARNSRTQVEKETLIGSYSKMSLTRLKELALGTKWATMLSEIITPESQVPFDEAEEVILMAPDFLPIIDNLIQTTPSETIANYLITRIVLRSMRSLDAKWRELAHLHAIASTGATGLENREQTCLESISSSVLATSLSALYVRNTFKPEQRANAIEMVGHLRDQLKLTLEQADWLDEETRQKALLKANSMLEFVAYPEELLNDEMINNYYKSLDGLKSDELFKNELTLWKLEKDLQYAALRQTNDRSDWRKHARLALINAFYMSMTNSIDIPAAIFQDPFYNLLNPAYVNFGAIGHIIGREIIHGFDTIGRLFDESGQLKMWWTPEASANFQTRAECFVGQYNNFTVPNLEVKVDGQLTLRENIADNGGVKSAFYAYQRYRTESGDLARLPGFEQFDQDQLFWISFASNYCGKLRPEYQAQQLASQSHAPLQFRVNGPLTNSKEFASNFKCALGTPMNPATKCSVW